MSNASHVLIRGHVFKREEKEPFVASGKSVLGALEYDEERNRIKCHECGEWFQHISWKHLKAAHDLSMATYKLRHGINQTTGLCTPSFSRMRAAGNAAAGNPKQTALLVEAGRIYKRLHGNNLTNRNSQTERLNDAGKCQAQTLFRVQIMAAELGRTPTSREFQAAGIAHLMMKHFGSMTDALALAGLQVRGFGDVQLTGGSLPEGFPSKEELLERRMPWPKEYFRVSREAALEQRRSA